MLDAVGACMKSISIELGLFSEKLIGVFKTVVAVTEPSLL